MRTPLLMTSAATSFVATFGLASCGTDSGLPRPTAMADAANPLVGMDGALDAPSGDTQSPAQPPEEPDASGSADASAPSDGPAPLDAAVSGDAGTPADAASAGDSAADTDWMRGRYGVGIHYLKDWLSESKLGGSAEWNATVNSFDVNAFVSSIAQTGARWLLFTIGQNSGYYDAPCPLMDSVAGWTAGERCSNRDLVLDIARALDAKNIKLILYLPSQVASQDAQMAAAFGLTVRDSNGNYHVDAAFVQKWATVIADFSKRYGQLVAGWWFDGFYAKNGFVPADGQTYAAAAKAGNPAAIVALNGGTAAFSRQSPAQDYLAGESRTIAQHTCPGPTVDGLQCQIFTPLAADWPGGPIPYTTMQVLDYTNQNVTMDGAVTWNLAIDGAGVVPPPFVDTFVQIEGSIRARP